MIDVQTKLVRARRLCVCRFVIAYSSEFWSFAFEGFALNGWLFTIEPAVKIVVVHDGHTVFLENPFVRAVLCLTGLIYRDPFYRKFTE